MTETDVDPTLVGPPSPEEADPQEVNNCRQ